MTSVLGIGWAGSSQGGAAQPATGSSPAGNGHARRRCTSACLLDSWSDLCSLSSFVPSFAPQVENNLLEGQIPAEYGRMAKMVRLLNASFAVLHCAVASLSARGRPLSQARLWVSRAPLLPNFNGAPHCVHQSLCETGGALAANTLLVPCHLYRHHLQTFLCQSLPCRTGCALRTTNCLAPSPSPWPPPRRTCTSCSWTATTLRCDQAPVALLHVVKGCAVCL